MADARAGERGFFESHPEYLEVAPQVGWGLGLPVGYCRLGWAPARCVGSRRRCRTLLQLSLYIQAGAGAPLRHPRPAAAAAPSAQCGVGHLARVLNTLLVEHIRGLLPSLRTKIGGRRWGRCALCCAGALWGPWGRGCVRCRSRAWPGMPLLVKATPFWLT